MRCHELARVLLAHLVFISIVWLFFSFLRIRTPSIAADHLLHSANLNKEQLNEERLQEARRAINQTDAFPFSKGEKASVEVRILASDRRRGYLTQVVGYLLKTFEGKSLPSLSICNVEGEIFEELRQFEGKIPIYALKGQKVVDHSLTNAMIKKETADYWQCLKIPTSSRYVLLLEDDSLVIPEFPNLLTSLVFQLDFRPDISFVKLYHPSLLRKIPSIPIAICTCFSSILLFQWMFYRRIHFLHLLLSSVILYVILRSFTYQLIADLRYSFTGSAYISMPESCCTPAVVFRTTIKDVMATELMKEKSYEGRAKDHILDDSRFSGRQSDCNWVVHIGAFSQVRNKEVRLSEQPNEDKSWRRFFL